MKISNSKLPQAVLAGLLLSSGAVLAASNGLYIGGTFGQADSDLTPSDVDEDFVGTVDDTDTAWKVLAGYQFNPNFAVEAAYVDLGENAATGTINGTAVTASGDVTGWQIAGIGRLPLGERAGLFGKVGLFAWDSDATATVGGAAVTESDDGSDVMYGAGVDFDLSDSVSLRAEWERFQTEPSGESLDFDVWSASVLIRFR